MRRVPFDKLVDLVGDLIEGAKLRWEIRKDLRRAQLHGSGPRQVSHNPGTPAKWRARVKRYERRARLRREERQAFRLEEEMS